MKIKHLERDTRKWKKELRRVYLNLTKLMNKKLQELAL